MGPVSSVRGTIPRQMAPSRALPRTETLAVGSVGAGAGINETNSYGGKQRDPFGRAGPHGEGAAMAYHIGNPSTTIGEQAAGEALTSKRRVSKGAEEETATGATDRAKTTRQATTAGSERTLKKQPKRLSSKRWTKSKSEVEAKLERELKWKTWVPDREQPGDERCSNAS